MIKISRTLAYLPILIFAYADCDLECYEMRKENIKYLELKVLETNLEADQFSVLRNPVMTRTGNTILLSIYLENLYSHRVSSDLSTLFLDDGLDLRALDFSAPDITNPFFDDASILKFDKSFYSSDIIDLSIENEILLRSEPDGATFLSEQYEQNKYHLTSINTSLEVIDTLHTVYSDFQSPTRFIVRQINKPRILRNGNTYTFSIHESHYAYDTTAVKNYFSENFIEDTSILVAMNDDRLDTLFKVDKPYLLYQATENYLFVELIDKTLVYSNNGEFIKTFPYRFERASNSGETFITENENHLIYTESEEMIDLSNYTNSTTYAVTNDHYVLLVQENKYIDIISLINNSKIASITTNKIPGLKLDVDKKSTLGMFFPTFISDTKIRFLFTDSYYIDNPYDDCEI